MPLSLTDRTSFWAYELSKRAFCYQEEQGNANLKILLAGGIAGVVTWASIFPLDVIKTRIQSPKMFDATFSHMAEEHLLAGKIERKVSAAEVARQVYRQEGFGSFFRGLGVCSVRAFIVNAVQVRVAPKHGR